MEDRPMTIIEHLEELRRRLLISFAALGIGGAIGWLFVDRVLDYLIRTMGVDRVVFFAPAEALFIRLKIALFVGVFIAAPVVLYQLWSFIAVGLTHTERRTVMFLLPPSLVLFALGSAFGLFVILPVGLKVLLSYQTATLQPLLAIGPTLSFVIAFAGSTVTVVGKDNVYEPVNVTIKAGQEYEFAFDNKGTTVHNYIINSKDQVGQDFTSDIAVNGGQVNKFKVKIDKPGAYKVTCTYHPEMTGEVKVE